MTTDNNDIGNTPDTNNASSAPASSAWGKWAAIGAVAAMLIGGAGVAGALSDEGGHFGMGGFGGPRHMMGGGPFGHGGPGMGIGRVMDGIDATDEQEDKLWTIFDGVHSDLRPVLRDFRDTRDDLAKLLSAETIDTAAVEKLRSERLGELDGASKKITTAMVEAAQVLTPEQRAKLMEHLEDRGRRGRW